MKKRRFLLIALMCCFVFAGSILVACNGEDSDFTVSFDTQGGSNIAEITVGNGQVIGEVAPPTKQCARFIGFALDAGGERMWNLQTDTMSANITLYAIWEDAHTWGEWADTTPATCTEDGERTRECEVCGKTENEAIDALGHDYAEEYTEDVAPGCETTGSESRHCTRCGATTDSREIEALGHNYMVWAHDDTNHWQTCSRCGAVSEKTAHVYDTDGKCECGAMESTPASEFTFTDLGNNTWSVDGYSGSDSAIVIPSRYNGGKVISIGYEAFAYRTGLTSVTIPDSVTSIGDRAFCNCTGLTSVTIGDGVMGIGSYAFAYCRGLTSITIPAGVTSIGYEAFRNCTGLTSITIPNSVTSIGDRAFYDCSGLTSVTIGKGITSIGYSAFWNCSGLTSVTIPDSVTSIGSDAFLRCTGLTSVTIGNSVTSIGSSAFSGCTGLTSVTIPDSVTSIGGSAFSGCSGLTSVTIPDGVTSIGAGAFWNCSGLTSVTIGTGVTSIGNEAFAYCMGLTEINWNAVSVADFNSGSNVFYNAGAAGDGIAVTFGESVEKIPAYLFYAYSSYSSSYRPNIKSVIIGSDVTSIGGYAFYNCTGLTSITIPDSVTSIGEHAFYNCSGLTSIYYTGDITGWLNISGLANLTSRISSECKLFLDGTIIGGDIIIPDGVESIPSYAFAYQTGITSVTIGDSVTSIESHAFSGCSGLKSITIPFVGAEADNTSSDPYQYRFGYIFGTTSYTGGTGVGLIYDSNGTIVGSSLTYYIPSSLREVTVTGGNIFLGAFYGCNGLTSVTIGDGVTRIGDFAFSGCSGLTAVTIGDGVTNIGDGAFAGCLGLTSITIPDSVTSIGLGAFGECTGLKSITIPDSVTSIGSSAFAYCTGLTSVTIGDGVTSIGYSAFSECTGLTSVTFEETSGWFVSESSSATSGINISAGILSDKSTAARYLRGTYDNYYWKRNA